MEEIEEGGDGEGERGLLDGGRTGELTGSSMELRKLERSSSSVVEIQVLVGLMAKDSCVITGLVVGLIASGAGAWGVTDAVSMVSCCWRSGNASVEDVSLGSSKVKRRGESRDASDVDCGKDVRG